MISKTVCASMPASTPAAGAQDGLVDVVMEDATASGEILAAKSDAKGLSGGIAQRVGVTPAFALDDLDRPCAHRRLLERGHNDLHIIHGQFDAHPPPVSGTKATGRMLRELTSPFSDFSISKRS